MPLWLQCWRLGATFSGRAPLKEFYAFAIPQLILFVWGLFYMVNGVGVDLREAHLCAHMWDAICSDEWLTLWGVFLFISIVPSMALCVRRAHDFGIGFYDLADESTRYELDEDKTSWLDFWWRVRMALSGPIGWIMLIFEKKIDTFLTYLTMLVCMPIRVWFEDSLPGPNEYGPGTRYPRFLDAPVDDRPFRD